MIAYPTEDYKKYIHALGTHRVRRLYDLFGGLDPSLETSDDFTSSLHQLELWLYLAAFVDDDDVGDEIGWNVRDLMRGDEVKHVFRWAPGRNDDPVARWLGHPCLASRPATPFESPRPSF